MSNLFRTLLSFMSRGQSDKPVTPPSGKGLQEPGKQGVKPPLKVQVVSPEVGYLNVRPLPSTTQPPTARADDGAVLDPLEPETDVQAKVGQYGQWLHIRTPEGTDGYVAAWYLRLYKKAEPVPPPPSGVQVQVVSPVVGYLNVRPLPYTTHAPIAQVDDGAILKPLETEADVQAKVGQHGQWLHIRTPEGTAGYVAAWYLRLYKKAEPVPPPPKPAGVRVQVVSPDEGYLNVRPLPSTAQSPIAQVNDGAILEPLEPEADVQAKVGQHDRWLHIRTPEGTAGYVAAWYLRLYDGTPVPPPEATAYLNVSSPGGMNVRQGQSEDTARIWRVPDQTVLKVLEDPKEAAAKIGKDQWVRVRTPSLHEGYVNGRYINAKRLADKRRPVDDTGLPRGESAWIFGIHAAGATTPADFRFLFENKHKTGWVLFSEAVGADPHHGGGHNYTSWSNSGYGVIVRLNNGYEPGGTLPVRTKYADFAHACARYVQNSQGCHIWIIGNEQNNVREHPGGAEHPIEHITPQMYAEAFNLARRRIKAVQPEAIVTPGAVDPYNTYPWKMLGGRRNRPLEYFKEMLRHIDDLDGIALHTYTHWMDVGLITSKTVFTDEFLQPGTPHEHYYDFQAYRPFAEAIPEKWRDRPIYITESNHWIALEHQGEGKAGWVNKDKGWVQAAYAEIHRWNSAPHAQQIHCLLIYRWTGDEWAIERLWEVQNDFKKALNHDYRWRR